jgi:hypothetical protein
LIAHAIIVMRNWSVAGSIRRHFVPSDKLIQAVYLREFVPEFHRRLSGHQGEWLFANALAIAAITTMVSAIAQPCAAVVFPETAASMAEQWGLRDRAGLTTARAFANAAYDGRLR